GVRGRRASAPGQAPERPAAIGRRAAPAAFAIRRSRAAGLRRADADGPRGRRSRKGSARGFRLGLDAASAALGDDANVALVARVVARAIRAMVVDSGVDGGAEPAAADRVYRD